MIPVDGSPRPGAPAPEQPPVEPAGGAAGPVPVEPDDDDDDEDWSWIGHDDPDDRESEGWWERFRGR